MRMSSPSASPRRKCSVARAGLGAIRQRCFPSAMSKAGAKRFGNWGTTLCATAPARRCISLARSLAPLIRDQNAWFAGVGGLTLVRSGRVAKSHFRPPSAPLPPDRRRHRESTDNYLNRARSSLVESGDLLGTDTPDVEPRHARGKRSGRQPHRVNVKGRK